MKPQFNPEGLAKPKAWEYAVRFLFGGVIAVVARCVSDSLGDFAGGLALAFPAILPAALTLVNEHDGRTRAADDARGARLGSLGLTAFAGVTLLTANRGPGVALPLAMLAWTAVAVGSWWLSYGQRRA